MEAQSPIATAGIIGDVHAEAELLEVALRELQRAKVDAILVVGDIVDGDGDVDRCVALLREAKAASVAGNHERWMLANEARDLPQATLPGSLAPATLDYLRSLPRTRSIPTVGGPLLLCHGMGDRDMASLRPDEDGVELEQNEPVQQILDRRHFAWVVAGHTHQRMARRLGGVTFVNAGTLHRPHDPCFGAIDFVREAVRFTPLAGGRLGTTETTALVGLTAMFGK